MAPLTPEERDEIADGVAKRITPPQGMKRIDTPSPTISEKTKFSWQVVVTIVTVALSIGGSALVARAADKKATDLETDVKALKATDGELRTDVAVLKTKDEARTTTEGELKTAVTKLTDAVQDLTVEVAKLKK